MAEKRLIDANALHFSQRFALADPEGEKMIPVLAVDRKHIEQAPTVDAVEVVRCKDCKHYNVFLLECHNGHMNGVIGIDGFCSGGERRTDV